MGRIINSFKRKAKIIKSVLSRDCDASNVAKRNTFVNEGLLAILRDEYTTREQKNEALRQSLEGNMPIYLGQLNIRSISFKTDEGNKSIGKLIELLQGVSRLRN
jgi:hypothetical protein